jgi:hypothetical protein
MGKDSKPKLATVGNTAQTQYVNEQGYAARYDFYEIHGIDKD